MRKPPWSASQRPQDGAVTRALGMRFAVGVSDTFVRAEDTMLWNTGDGGGRWAEGAEPTTTA